MTDILLLLYNIKRKLTNKLGGILRSQSSMLGHNLAILVYIGAAEPATAVETAATARK